MKDQAWLMLAGAWSVIIGCTAYCFYRILTSKRRFGSHPVEEEPPPGE
jgi:hypothetical protein